MILQLHYLSPAKHLLKSQLKVLENLVNSLETENRCRAKRSQHPLIYYEAYNLPTQLVGGDVLNACHSANINWDVYTSATLEEGLISDDHKGGIRNGSNHRGNQQGRGRQGKSSSERGKSSGRNNQQERKDGLSGHSVRISILPMAVQPQIVQKSIVAVRDLLVALSATRRLIGTQT